MAKYNIVRNGDFTSATTSGTGNVDLSWSQLESLIDGNLTSAGVSLTTSGNLYLDVDLSQRIKVDGIRLYASDLTKSSNISFYYRNTVTGTYTLLSTSVGSYYYTTIPDPSAPQFVRATISGVNINLYEFQIFNDDQIVAFGEDGQAYAEYISDTPIGEEGSAQSIAIYNDGDSVIPADAYVAIDYTGADADNYLKISSSQNGTYYELADGVLQEGDAENETYRWSMGTFSGTEISTDKVVISSPSVSGTYTTPIFKLVNKYNASYFIVNGDTTTSGDGSISYDPDVYNGTIRVKNSDTAPLIMNEIFLLCNDQTTNMTVHKYDIYTGNATYDWHDMVPDYGRYITAVDRRTGYVATSQGRTSDTGRVRIYDQSGNLLYMTFGDIYGYPDFLEFDKSGGLWHFSLRYTQLTLRHFDYQLNEFASAASLTGLYHMSVEMDGAGIWYTDSVDGLVLHLDEDAATLNTIVLDEPRAICGKLDNGCWVIDNGDQKAYEYSSAGDLVKTVSLGRDGDHMSSDLADGFYYISGNSVYHVTSAGTEDLALYIGPNLSRVYGGHEGCIVWNSTSRWTKYIDKSAGAVTRTWDVYSRTNPSTNPEETGFPALRSIKYDDYKDFKITNGVFPASYDPVWGTGGTAFWSEVRKDGYFLPKYQYQQVEVTLRNSAMLEQVIMAPAIRIQDIPRQSYKYMYIKTDIPEGVNVDQYESRLKSWWGVAE